MAAGNIIDAASLKIVQELLPVVSAQNTRLAEDIFSLTKRVLVVTGALVLIAFLLPLFLTMATLIRLDGGSWLYAQKRLGEGGRHFTLWKLRSMVPDAERMLAEHIASDAGARTEWEANQKLTRDPRVTSIGRILRKYSLDELPQLFNVLCGDMSLVGPRPMMIDQESLYPGLVYAGLRPGLTGLWQISKRDDATFAARARFDAAYAAKLSLGEDFRIAFLTLGYFVRGRGQ